MTFIAHKLRRVFHTINRIFTEEGAYALLLAFLKELSPLLASRLYHRPKINYSNKMLPIEVIGYKNPKITIVIPTYNKFLYTYNCVKSISESKNSIPYRILLVDDASTEDSQPLSKVIKGIRWIVNEENIGFLRSCNNAITTADTDYVVLLNNDTIVQDFWLDKLFETLESDNNIGVVGAKLLYPTGALQEAGGVVWEDGSAWNIGNKKNPDHPNFNYMKEVDYCSGACVLFRRADFMALNGFDERYKPAYYEDTDFCFRVRYELGKQVVYQPLAEVIHFEGVSHGKKQSHGLKKYQELNRSKFIEKWGYILKDRLKKEHLPAADDLNYFPKLKKILIIDSRIPMPDKDSGSVRMFEIINILIGLKCHVTFLPDNLSINGLDADKLKFVGVKLVGGPYYSVRSYLKENASNYDYVLISKADVAKRNLNWALKYCRNSKLIFDTVDLHHLRERREGEIKSSKLRIMKSKRRYRDEISYVKRSDLTLVVSNEEKEYILKECPRSNVKVLSNIHDVKLDIPKFTDRNGILFIGGYEHPPNVDAVLFFANEIWPKIVEQRPDMVWFVVGSKMPESIKALKSNNISILGYLPDLSEILGRVRLTVAPLRYGAGVKGKVNTSMSFGVPSVISHVAAEGLHAIDGKDTLIADSPDEWVNKILRIYDDEDLWNRVSLNGKVNVSSHFSHERALAVLSEIVLQ